MDKKDLREICLKRLRSQSYKKNFFLDKSIELKIERLIKKLKPRSILFYMPLDIEVNLTKLIAKYRKRLKILIPKVENKSFKMVEYRLPLEEKSFSILEPKSSNYIYKNVDLIIVPIVAMDKNMQRIGFGKGMYDRFYDSLNKKPSVIFVQRVPCKSRVSICDKYDIKCDFYVTSKEKIELGKKDGKFFRDRNRSISRLNNNIFRYKTI